MFVQQFFLWKNLAKYDKAAISVVLDLGLLVKYEKYLTLSI